MHSCCRCSGKRITYTKIYRQPCIANTNCSLTQMHTQCTRACLTTQEVYVHRKNELHKAEHPATLQRTLHWQTVPGAMRSDSMFLLVEPGATLPQLVLPVLPGCPM
eukprot:GHRR01007700.1.p1 GENE.GHRR01007700.1~~GHRR01007700.1.p1  ORF type:complete len:106 (-),score=7.30 GHRR01007700.1:1082-1399(-)